MTKVEWNWLDKLPSKLLLISDLHIGVLEESEDEAYQKLVIKFIESKLASGYHIYLLGDIFDYWLEYESEIPPIGEIFRSFLENISDKNAISIVTGNHDNWTLNYFSSLQIMECSEGIRLNNYALFCHGDGFKDTSLHLKRPLKHRILRNSYFIRLFKAIFSKNKAWQIMREYSKNSAKKSEKYPSETDRLNNWASAIQTKFGFKIVVCGHDHVGRLCEFKNGYLLNCGYFLKERTFGEMIDSKIKLLRLEDNLSESIVVERRLETL